MTLALPTNMTSCLRIIATMSPEVTLCIRGAHAIGKSEGVYQGAALRFSDFYKNKDNCKRMVEAMGDSILRWNISDKPVTEWHYEMGIPVLERRLSQLTEGDIIGLPFLKDNKSTQFKPCDWLIHACEFPVVLFLDERNRALEGVRQSVFQLADSKMFYGNRLHAETFIVIAENVGDAYQVGQLDPAEISRTATILLNPDIEEWLDYAAKVGCHPIAIDFWRQHAIGNNEHSAMIMIENRGIFEPNKKYPDRRSWIKLDRELRRSKLYENPNDHLFYVMVGAFCGVEAASAFKQFFIENDKNVTAEEILSNWDKTKMKLIRDSQAHISSEKFLELGMKLTAYMSVNEVSQAQAIEFARFLHESPPEIRIATFTSALKNKKNIVRVWPHIESLIVLTTKRESVETITPPVSISTNEEEDESPANKRGIR